MKFANLIKNLGLDNLPEEIKNLDVNKICIDCDKVKKGDVFLLLKRDKQAIEKILRAFENGASISLAEGKYDIKNCFSISNSRKSFALMEKRLHGSICDRMKIIGVTGTNGKTTITHLVYHILKSAGKKVGLIGTLGYKTDGPYTPTGFTTPDPDMLHEIFERMESEGIEYVVMEVSAHALALEKLKGIKFEVSVLTNITQDHLDFFGTMEKYEQAKHKLFSKRQSLLAVVCSDCIDLEKFLLKHQIPTISYAINSPSDVFAVNINQTLQGTEFFCNCNDELFSVSTNLVGDYNVENTLGAIAVCSSLGIGVKEICLALKYAPPIDGRFNVLKKDGKNIVVDFAHTPDGLEKAIQTARQFTSGRLITMFGCGGERDEGKRPIMGRICSSLSDVTVLTSDNPRHEDPMKIICDIQKGITKGTTFVEPDRAKAVKIALEQAKAGDTVLLAGKGAEKEQVIGDTKYPYDDFEEVYKFFRSKFQVIEGDANVEHFS